MRAKDFTQNPTMIVTVLIGIFVNALLVTVPFLAGLFDLTMLGGPAWILVFLSSLAIVPIGEAYKAGMRFLGRKKEIKMPQKRTLARESRR